MRTSGILALGLLLGCLRGCAPSSEEPERSGGPANPAQQKPEAEPSPRLKAGEQAEQPQAGGLQPELTAGEIRLLRGLVKQGAIGTSIDMEGRWATHRVAVLDKYIREVHREKRIATLRLLLDIIRCGTPKEALTAASCADVLEGGEEGVLMALEWHDHSPARVDARGNDDEMTTRQILFQHVEDMIAIAQGRGKEKGKGKRNESLAPKR